MGLTESENRREGWVIWGQIIEIDRSAQKIQSFTGLGKRRFLGQVVSNFCSQILIGFISLMLSHDPGIFVFFRTKNAMFLYTFHVRIEHLNVKVKGFQ